jgi:hypothetical protein
MLAAGNGDSEQRLAAAPKEKVAQEGSAFAHSSAHSATLVAERVKVVAGAV